MIVANQDSHDLSMLRIDSDAGQLAAIGEGYKTGSPVCVIAADRQYRGAQTFSCVGLRYAGFSDISM